MTLLKVWKNPQSILSLLVLFSLFVTHRHRHTHTQNVLLSLNIWHWNATAKTNALSEDTFNVSVNKSECVCARRNDSSFSGMKQRWRDGDRTNKCLDGYYPALLPLSLLTLRQKIIKKLGNTWQNGNPGSILSSQGSGSVVEGFVCLCVIYWYLRRNGSIWWWCDMKGWRVTSEFILWGPWVSIANVMEIQPAFELVFVCWLSIPVLTLRAQSHR